MSEKHDAVNHPAHYTSHPSGVECIQITEHMGFCLGNAVKYIWRADLKHDDAVEDLEKARWYVDRELAKRGRDSQGAPAGGPRGVEEYLVENDKFEFDEKAERFSFPCCACRFRYHPGNGVPCDQCGHNVNDGKFKIQSGRKNESES